MKRVIRFTASWCGPCKMLSRNLEDIKTEIPVEVIDIDENQTTAIDFGVRGVPTLIMLDGNTEMKRLVGMTSLKELQDWFDND